MCAYRIENVFIRLRIFIFFQHLYTILIIFCLVTSLDNVELLTTGIDLSYQIMGTSFCSVRSCDRFLSCEIYTAVRRQNTLILKISKTFFLYIPYLTRHFYLVSTHVCKVIIRDLSLFITHIIEF